MSRVSIISDATSLIILGKLDRFDILENIFDTIIIPQGIMDEISVKNDDLDNKIINNPIFEIKAMTNIVLFALLEGVLDKGECESIILSKDLDKTLLIDEKKGRAIAKDMGLNIIGLMGLLILNIKKGKLSIKGVLTIFESIKKLGFRVSVKLETYFLVEINRI
jgi:predicted nucleic acid-binding protein